MVTVIQRVLQTNIKKIVIYLLINFLFVLMLAAMFPALFEEAEKFNELLSSYPAEMLQAFGMADGASFFKNFETFLGGEYLSFMWPILLITFVSGFSSYSIAGEIEKGTIDLLLSQPISRIKLYFSKFFAGLGLLVILISGTILMIWPIAKIFDVSVIFIHLVTLSLGGLLFGGAVMSLGFMFSSMVSTKAKASGVTIGVIIVMYALNLLANLNLDYDKLKYFSYFHYFDYNVLLIEGKITWQTIGILLTSGALFAVIGAYIFNKRDIST